MSQWKSILVVALFLVGLTPTATSQASVAYSVSFTDGQVNIDIEKDDYFISNINISEDNESRMEFDHSMNEGDNRYFVGDLYSFKFISEKVLVLTVYVSWSIENWTNTDNFTVEFGELVESTSEQNGTMELTWYGHENLTASLSNPEHKAYGRAENASDFKSSFFAPGFIPHLFFELAVNEDDGGDTNYTTIVRISVETKVITWELEDISSAFGCTEMVISNEGQSSIDVDVEFSGGGLTFSPAVVSVTLAPGGSATAPVCVTVMGFPYKTVQVSAWAQGRETNTQTNQVNKNAGFVVNIAPFLDFYVYSTPSHDICNTTEITFTAVNNGNYQDTAKVRISNIQELKAAGFVIALAAQQYLIDSQGEQPVRITVNSTGVENTKKDYPLTLNVSTTLQGDDTSAESTTIMKFVECQEEKETVDKDDSQKDKDNSTSSDEGGSYEGDDAGECSDEADNDRNGLFDCDDEGCSGSPACKASDSEPTDDSRLPSLSLLAVVTILGIISILRRR